MSTPDHQAGAPAIDSEVNDLLQQALTVIEALPGTKGAVVEQRINAYLQRVGVSPARG